MNDDDIVDIVVVGGGIAGMASAMAAVQAGAKTLLLEETERLGGTLWFSGGSFGTTDSYDSIRARIPDGDPDLQRVLTDGIVPAFDWLDSLDLPLGPIKRGQVAGSVHINRSVFPPGFAIIFDRRLRTAGAAIVTNATVTDARKTGRGWSVTVQPKGQPASEVECRAVIFATGGFASNRYFVQKYMGLDPDKVYDRTSGHSSGMGLKIALANGSEPVGAMDLFYGHNMPAPPAKLSPEDFLVVGQRYGGWVPALNIHGLRYCDEAEAPPPTEETLAQATARQPGGVAFYFFDEVIYQKHVANVIHMGSPVKAVPNKYLSARDAGGLTWQADSLEELVSQMADQFTSSATALETLQEYNQAAVEGRAAALPVPKGDPEFAIPLLTPPFYAVAVRAGITLTMGGIRVDQSARVLNKDGLPIDGLFAAGADIGNVYNRLYNGGLALGLVFGRVAGAAAAQSVISTVAS